jgi:hypothetical protein
MPRQIRKFALLIIDDFEREIDRFPLDYVETPKNLGFEIEFTTLESRLTTYFTGAREKKTPTELLMNFLPPYAYQRVTVFKAFVQKYMNSRMVFEYYDTAQIKNWEGKLFKLGQEELTEYGGLECPVQFLPATPKYIRRDNVITIRFASGGKSYPFKYPYNYGKVVVENNRIENNYFDEIPIRAAVYGTAASPTLFLFDTSVNETYSTVQFDGLALADGEHVVIDSVSNKILLYRNGGYQSAYNYLNQSPEYDSFLFARQNTVSILSVNLDPTKNGYLKASYREYTL